MRLRYATPDELYAAPLPDRVWKQFTARDVVSRWDTLELGRRATAQLALMKRYGIQVPVLPWPTPWTPGFDAEMPRRRVVRLSAHLYNDCAEYDLLAEGLAGVLG